MAIKRANKYGIASQLWCLKQSVPEHRQCSKSIILPVWSGTLPVQSGILREEMLIEIEITIKEFNHTLPYPYGDLILLRQLNSRKKSVKGYLIYYAN